MWKKIDPSEKKVMKIALVFAIALLGLIGYAAFKLGINVPFCENTVQHFTKGQLIKHGERQFEVQMVSSMWKFEPSEIRIPTGSTVQFYLSSIDVNHGFHINQTNVNLMAVPGAVNSATHTFNKPGRYHMICHEYCGVGHQNMAAWIIVEDNITAEASGIPGLADTNANSEGSNLYSTKGCAACHAADLAGVAGVGPGLKGIFGTTISLVDGSSVLVDDNYLRESIINPTKQTVKGYNPIMPAMPLTESEVSTLIQYIKNTK